MMSLLAVCLLSALVGRLVFLCNPFDADAAIFTYMGKMTYDGGRMCHDFLDNKFPSVGLAMTVPWRWFGNDWAGYVLLSTTLALLSCLILAETARRAFGKNAGFATLFFSLVYLNFTRMVFGGFQLETCQIFFDALAVFFIGECLRSERMAPAVVAGMAAGCAALFKPTGLSVLGAFVLCRLIFPRPKIKKLSKNCNSDFVGAALAAPTEVGSWTASKQLIGIALGVAVPAAVVVIYLKGADLLADMPGLYRQISGYASNSAIGLPNFLKLPVVLFILGLPLVLRGWIFRRRRIEIPSDQHARSTALFIVLWLFLEVASVVMQRRMYWYHFLVLVPPASILFGMIPRKSSAIFVAACVMPLAVYSIGAASDTLDQLYKATPVLEKSEYLIAHAKPTDRVWDENASRMLLETNLQSGARCVLTFLFANSDDSPLIFSRQILEDFASSKPKYIVLHTDLNNWVYWESRNIWDIENCPMRRVNYLRAWRHIGGYVHTNYVPVARMDQETIWERRGKGLELAGVDR